MLFSVCNQLLEGNNEVIVANIEADIAIDIITIITRRIVGRISLACICGYPDFIIKAKTTTKALLQCNKGYGQEIFFDANNKSQSGNFIPLDKGTG
jgi:hypothetical protein